MDSMQFQQRVSKKIHGYGLTIPKVMFEAHNFKPGEKVIATVEKNGKAQTYSPKILTSKSKKKDGRLYFGYYIHIPKHCVISGAIEYDDVVNVTMEKTSRGVGRNDTGRY